ncbi:MAG: hypothetical protein WA738_01725, partial [Candidatus Angelobacter sp.]
MKGNHCQCIWQQTACPKNWYSLWIRNDPRAAFDLTPVEELRMLGRIRSICDTSGFTAKCKGTTGTPGLFQ